MKNIRVQRLEHELSDRLHARKQVFEEALRTLLHHPQHWPSLREGDIALMPGFREVMCAPDGAAVTKDNFDAVAGQMEKHGKELDERVRKELLQLVYEMENKGEKNDADEKDSDVTRLDGRKLPDASVLGLARTCFRCTRCGQVLFYPGVLTHKCLRKLLPTPDKADAYEEFVVWQVLTEGAAVFPIKIAGVVEACDPPSGADDVLKLCGKDLRTVTTEEMDALSDHRFVSGGSRLIMTWRAMVSPRRFTRYLGTITDCST